MVEKIYDFHEDFSPPGYVDLFYAKGQKARVLDTDVQDLIEAKPSRATNLTALDILSVDTIADLKALDPTLLGTANRIHVLGYTTASDGGARVLVYDSTSTATANDVSIFAPDSGDGRYLHNGPVWPECAGCNKDAADNSTALQRLADANIDVAGRGREYAYKHSTAINLPPGHNAVIDSVATDIGDNEYNMSSWVGVGADFTDPVDLTAAPDPGATELTVASGDEADFTEGTIALIHQKKNWAARQINRGMNSDWVVCGPPRDGVIKITCGNRVWFDTGATLTVSGITRANPGVITATGHGLTVGEIYEVAASGIVGMTELNGQDVYIEIEDANTAKLVTASGNDVATDLKDITFSGLTDYFDSGETVNFSPSGAVGTVTSINNSAGTMSVRITSGTATAADDMTGVDSDATADVDTIADQYSAYTSGGTLTYAPATVRAWQSELSPKFRNCTVLGNPQWSQTGIDLTRAYKAEIASFTGENLREKGVRLKCCVGTVSNGTSRFHLDRVIDRGVTAVTAARPPVVSSVAHGLEDGVRIEARDFEGMTELNGNEYYVNRIDADSYSLVKSSGDPVDGRDWTAMSAAGVFEIDYGNRYGFSPNGGFGEVFATIHAFGIRHGVANGASAGGSGNMPAYVVQRVCHTTAMMGLDLITSGNDVHAGGCDISFGTLNVQMRGGDGEDAYTIQGCRVTVGQGMVTGNRAVGFFIQNLGYGDITPEESDYGVPNFVRSGPIDISDPGSQQSDETNSILRVINWGKVGGVLHEVSFSNFSGTGEDGIYLEARTGDIEALNLHGGRVAARSGSALTVITNADYRLKRLNLISVDYSSDGGSGIPVMQINDGGNWISNGRDVLVDGPTTWITAIGCSFRHLRGRPAVELTGSMFSHYDCHLTRSSDGSVISASDDSIVGENGHYTIRSDIYTDTGTDSDSDGNDDQFVYALPQSTVIVTTGSDDFIDKAIVPGWYGSWGPEGNANRIDNQSGRLTLMPSGTSNVTVKHHVNTVGGFFCPGAADHTLTDNDRPLSFVLTPTPTYKRWLADGAPAHTDSYDTESVNGVYKVGGVQVLGQQQSTTGTTTGFTAGSGTAVNDDSTFTGNSGTAAYTVGDLVLALKNHGIIAAS